MPDSIEQYFELTLRQRALILWACCEHLVEADEAERVDAFPNVDWEDADAFRMTPRCHDARNNAYWYFDGSDGVLYREGTPAPSSAGRPTFEALSRGYEELAEVYPLPTRGQRWWPRWQPWWHRQRSPPAPRPSPSGISFFPARPFRGATRSLRRSARASPRPLPLHTSHPSHLFPITSIPPLPNTPPSHPSRPTQATASADQMLEHAGWPERI